MANESFMLPVTVTDIKEMSIIRNMTYPKLAACIPKGIRFLVTKSEAFYWDDCRECLIPIKSSIVFTEIFFPMAYLCERYGCTISGVIKPKKLSMDWFLYRLKETKFSAILNLEDVEIYLTDMYCADSSISTFEKRLDLLQTICSDIGEMGIDVADYKEVKSYAELAGMITTSLTESKYNNVLVRTKTGIFYNSSIGYQGVLDVYCSSFEISCNMEFEGVLEDIQQKVQKPTSSTLYSDEPITIATYFIVNYKGKQIKVVLTNYDTNINKATILSLRKLWLVNKSKLLKKKVVFSAFAFLPDDDSAPIGASFLKFKEL